MENSSSDERPVRPTVYPSGIDLWIWVMLMLSPVTSIVLGLYVLQEGHAGGAIVLFLSAAAVGSLTAAVTVPCRYTLHDDALSVRCGLICYQIPLAEIVSVSKSGTIISGPALSMKRVIIKTRKRHHILSPKRRDAFIDDLQHTLQQTESKESTTE